MEIVIAYINTLLKKLIYKKIGKTNFYLYNSNLRFSRF